METLSTERLIIRPFTMDDLSDVHQVLDQDVQWSGPSFSLERCQQRLQRDIVLAQWDMAGKIFGWRAIVLKENRRFIGICGFIPVFRLPEIQALFWPQLFGEAGDKPSRYSTFDLEIGYALSSRHRGKGYATEAIKEMLRYVFGRLKVERVFASTNRSNAGSIGLMKRIGMRTASNPEHPELDWPNAPGVLGVIENDLLTGSSS